MEPMANGRRGVRSHCWDCRYQWDGWLQNNPEGMPCPDCASDNTHHQTEFAWMAEEIEALREILRAFSFNRTTLRARNGGDPLYTAVGSLTGDQQDVLRRVLNPPTNGSSQETT